jgi:tetratricopeptide (TPR) repeat protein
MKALRYVISGLAAAAVLGLLYYQGFVTHTLTSSNLMRAVLILAGLILALLRPKKKHLSALKPLYKKTYGEFIQGAFSDDPKLENKLMEAIRYYNENKPGKGVERLLKLRKECTRSADVYAVTVFLALCYDDAGNYKAAEEAYSQALAYRPNATLWSNLGLCRQRLGQFESAQDAYENAILLNPNNPYAYNNLSALFFRDGDYESALEYAQQALEYNAHMLPALNTAAICCGIIGDEEGYTKYYRAAVANGGDGKKIKSLIQNLNPNIE